MACMAIVYIDPCVIRKIIAHTFEVFRVKAWMLLQITVLLLRNSSWIPVGQSLMFCLDGLE